MHSYCEEISIINNCIVAVLMLPYPSTAVACFICPYSVLFSEREVLPFLMSDCTQEPSDDCYH